MAETSSLLNCRTSNRTGGSNPPLTANKKAEHVLPGFFHETNRRLLQVCGMEKAVGLPKARRLSQLKQLPLEITSNASNPICPSIHPNDHSHPSSVPLRESAGSAPSQRGFLHSDHAKPPLPILILREQCSLFPLTIDGYAVIMP